MATPISVPTPSSSLARLVQEVRDAVRRAESEQEQTVRVAERLRPLLAERDLLTPGQREGGASGYRQHVLHVEPGGPFSVVVLVWLPGQETPVHDHVTWCATGVYEGREAELRFRTPRSGAGPLVAAGSSVNRAGSVSSLVPPGDIHLVGNPGPGRAVSLHVYGADIGRLGTSIRRVYPPEAAQRNSPFGNSGGAGSDR